MKEFRIGDTTYEVTAYITASEDRSKGIIRGIPDYGTSEDIGKSLVNERKPGILRAKRMGRTNHAIIVFQGTGHTEHEKRVDDTTALDDGREHRSSLRSRSCTCSRLRSRKNGDRPQLRASSGAGAPSMSTSKSGPTPIQKEGGQAGSGHPGPFEVSWADTVSGGRAKVEAAPYNANTENKKELAQIKQILMHLT
ncbi:hypothetical protein MTO96_029643 [Rhipicephalus appendiculatus]